MTERITLENTTPSEAWEGFVGNQSPAEFMAATPALSPLEAARQYVNDPIFARNQERAIDEGELDAIARLLARYIDHA